MLDEKGNVKEIKDIKKLEGKMLQKLKISDEKIKSKLHPVIVTEFGEEALKDKLQNMVIKQIANKKFSAGENWTSKEKSNVDLKTTINNNYKVSKTSDKICYVDVEGKTAADAKTDVIEADGIKFLYSGVWEESGKLEIEKENGMLSKSSILSKFSGNMDVKDGAKDLVGKKIPTSVENQAYIQVKGN